MSVKPGQIKIFENEIAILEKLNHPNIQCLHEFDKDQKRYYLVTCICKG